MKWSRYKTFMIGEIQTHLMEDMSYKIRQVQLWGEELPTSNRCTLARIGWLLESLSIMPHNKKDARKLAIDLYDKYYDWIEYEFEFD